MSRLDEFPSRWLNCLEQIEQYLKQQSIPNDAITARIDALAETIVQAEEIWRDVEPTVLQAQLVQLEQRRQQIESHLNDARTCGQEQIASAIKRLKRELQSLETPAKLANMHKTLDKFQDHVRQLVARSEECERTIEQHKTRLQQILAEVDELTEERHALENELKELTAQARTQTLRQECLALARATHQLGQTLREPLVAKASLTDG